jgi:ATP-dependent protease ClpP protease subunit
VTVEKFWAFKPTAAAAAASDEVDLIVYGYIAESAVWEDEVGARQFREDLDANKSAKRINVRINSGGGDAFAGIAIHNMLRAHPAEVVTTVEGLAASAASLIAMAGDRIIMARGSMLMIHNPAALAMGESSDLRKTAEVLDQLRDSLVSIYQARTKKSAEEIVALLDAETWLTAEQAIADGFADELAGEVKIENRGDKVFFASVGFPRRVVPMAEAEPPAEIAKDPEPAQPEPPAETAKDPEPAVEPEPAPPPAPTRETLAEQAPELLAALLDEGARAERARMRAIDDVAIPGHEALVLRARYDEPITAEALAVAILRAEREHRTAHLTRVAADVHETEVNASPLSPGGADAETRTVKAMAAGGTQRRTR